MRARVVRAPGAVGHQAPTMALLVGLIVTLAAVVAYSWYISVQFTGLRRVQTELADRSRRDSLQLLRIQNDLNQLALAMRDMLDTASAGMSAAGPVYPLEAWSSQFDRIRGDLDAALARQADVTIAHRTPEQASYLAQSVQQFWDAADRIFALARAGHDAEAREQVRLSLQARQAALSTAVARLLVQNNAAEADAALQVQEIYANVQRRVYWFLAAALVAIAGTSLYLIRANRQVFSQLAALSEERRDLAQQLITTRESTLREISRELHDEFGQLLTAMGSMLGRARRKLGAESPVNADLEEVTGIAQTALENVRGLSQTLHPSTLEALGLDSTIEWYLSTVERQLGLRVRYAREGTSRPVAPARAIHVYRVLQEALTNAARHSGAGEASVDLAYTADALMLVIEDHGRGVSPAARRSVGLVAMRERAAILGGVLDLETPASGGTRVRLRVPL